MQFDLLLTRGIVLINTQIQGGLGRAAILIREDPIEGECNLLDPLTGERHIVWIPPYGNHVHFDAQVGYGQPVSN